MYEKLTKGQYQRLLDFRLLAKHLYRDGLITKPELAAARAPVDRARRECPTITRKCARKSTK